LRAYIGWAAGLWLAAAGCIVTTVQQEKIPYPKTPARLEGKDAPALEATAVAGVKRALLDVPDVYYHEARERWFRWALGRWFVAFLWNGQWFPVDEGELPAEMAALEPSIQEKKERRLTRAEELDKIDEELRKLEQEPGQESGSEPQDAKDELRQLDEQLRKLEEEEKK
jgi:hypothetical protein